MKVDKWIFPLIVCATATILTIGNINGSSIGMYNFLFPVSTAQKPLLGTLPRIIRSDEWLVGTPLYFGHLKTGLPITSNLIGLKQNLDVLPDMPVINWTLLFKPQHWIALLMPVNYSLSAHWWSRAVFLLLSAYSFFYVITKKNALLASGLSWLLFWTPFLQWWYATSIVEMTALFFLQALLLWKIYKIGCGKILFVLHGLQIYVGVSFLLLIYPPYQVPLIILYGAIWLSLYLEHKYAKKTNTKNKWLHINILISLTVVGAILAVHFYQNRVVVSRIANTSYPGQRIVTGGNFAPDWLLRGFFGIQLQNENLALKYYGSEWLPNQSEAAGFLFITLIVIPFVLHDSWRRHKKQERVDYLLVSLSAFVLMLLFWILIGLPPPLNKFLLLDRTPSYRAIVGVWIAEIILIGQFLSSHAVTRTFYMKSAHIASLIASVFVIWVGLSHHPIMPDYFTLPIVCFLAFIAYTLVYLFFSGQSKAFIAIVGIFAFTSSWKVNPLNIGSDILINSTISKQLNITASRFPHEKWIVFNHWQIQGWLTGNGISTLSGVYFYPQPEVWKMLDPNGSYQHAWNRFAHVTFSDSTSLEAHFSLSDVDRFNISISPCHKGLRQLGAGIILSATPLNYSCLTSLDTIPGRYWNMYLYHLN